jgi:hypothetical protein
VKNQISNEPNRPVHPSCVWYVLTILFVPAVLSATPNS